MSHSPEPWTATLDGICDADMECVFDEGDWRLTDGNRERVIACVNACRWIPMERLAKLQFFPVVEQSDNLKRYLKTEGMTITRINEVALAIAETALTPKPAGDNNSGG